MQTIRTGTLGRFLRRRGWIVALLAIVFAAASAEAAGFGRKSTGRKGSSSGGSSSGDGSSSSSSSGSFGRRSTSSGSSRGSSSGGRNVAVVRPSYGNRGNTVYARPAPRVRTYSGYGYVDPYPRAYGWYDPFWGPWTGGYYTSWGVYPWGGYSYGYYPMWAAPPPPQDGPAEPSQASASLIGGLTLTPAGPMPFLTTHMDVGPFGVSGKFMGLVSAGVNGQPSELMPYASGHLTFSVLNLPSARVRVEGGVAGIVAPDVSYVGPDIGGSLQVALAGPLGLEGSVHWMPLPASVLDAQANVALNLGGLTLRAGWRTMVLDDSGIAAEGDGGTDVLAGPQASIGFVF